MVNDMLLPHTVIKGLAKQKLAQNEIRLTKTQITYGFRKCEARKKMIIFFLKKKAEPEIDVAILKKIQLVVRQKYHTQIQYVKFASFNSKLNNRFVCTICYRIKYNAIEISVTTNGKYKAKLLQCRTC